MSLVTLFFIWDVESTSNRPTEDDIISIGGVVCKYENRRFVELPNGEFHTYIYTEKKIDPAAENVHHISAAKLYGQPTFPQAMEKLRAFLRQHLERKSRQSSIRMIWMAHNGSKFDDIMLYCNFIQHRMNYDEFMRDVGCSGFLDSIKLFSKAFKGASAEEMPKDASTGRPSLALGHCYRSLCGGTALENAHDALVDSRALMAVCNCDYLCKTVDLRFLNRETVIPEKAIRMIKKSAGMAFQSMEKEARTGSSSAQSTGPHPMEIEPMAAQHPRWEDTSWMAQYPHAAYRLCLNCIQFVPIQRDQHQC